MSRMSIRPYLPFCRVRLVRQSVGSGGDMAWIEADLEYAGMGQIRNRQGHGAMGRGAMRAKKA